MQAEANIPKLPDLCERTTVILREGTLDVLADMARAAGYPNVGTYLRGIIEREIQACRPEDFRRLRGVG